MRKLAITEDSLRILADAFYDRVRADDMIGPVFNNAVLDGLATSESSRRSGHR